ncbi:MAG: hypothetical protein ACTHMI_15050 [Mucilaginibacter sp.]
MASETTIHAHKYQHFEDLQLSTKEFYVMLRDLISSYDYPGVTCEPVRLKEGGVFSSSRDYLRISKERYSFFVCAAPFGRSFFISWWLQEDANALANVAEKVPYIGKALATRIESKTYYELDTELMFTSSVNSLITYAIERVRVDKGYTRDNKQLPQS